MDNKKMHEIKNTGSSVMDDELYNYHLVLFSGADEMFDLWIPSTTEGFFRFTDNAEHSFLSISGKNGQWIAVCKEPAFFQNVPLNQSCEIPLENGQMLKINSEDRTDYLYVEKVYRKEMPYQNIFVADNIDINIGNGPNNDIWYENPYAAPAHAILSKRDGKWQIQNLDSTFGVFVNGTRKESTALKTGDIVCIVGLRIIIGPSFLSVNCGNGKTKIKQSTLNNSVSMYGGYSYYSNYETPDSKEKYFNRLPRKRIDMPQRVISVEGPPMSMNQNQIPLMLRMGSSMVMGGAAALAGNFMTLISSVMFPLLSSKYTDKQRQEYEQLRVTKYTEYLADKRLEIEDACREEKDYLNSRYPCVSDVINIVRQTSRIWERRSVDSDFLQLRLGTGTQKLSAAIEYPARRFELESDDLEEKMYELVEREHCINGVPMVLPMADTRICGLLGQRQLVLAYIWCLILQVAALHSYDEVKMVFFVKAEETKFLDEIRYLPHVWDNQRSVRFIATDEAEAYKLGEYIKNQISTDKDKEKNLHQVLKKRPFYLVFALDKKLLETHERMKEILQSDDVLGISIVAAYDELPKDSQKIISLESGRSVCTTMAADGGEDLYFKIDPCSYTELKAAIKTLSNIKLKTEAKTQEMPKSVTFLEMFGVGRIEQLNPLKRWKDNNPVSSLAAPIGVGEDGSLFSLDLHEKRQGPHGLVAGMTGSGKSEFLITYILSMAVNYHPDEVAFVLIDYKGGGLAGAFENPQTGVKLPHLVGTITNLDGASVQRSLMSIESELVRRQRVFSEVKSRINEGTMDIYAYQKLYREGKVSEPMPHLFIISDEFAELKQQQPEFMDKLISAARIGRSLGIHLILATQKPSGVVNDQIRSNTKFQVCLRVQERSDSMDMLKRPEAAGLTDTGRFYLQVGYNEYFALGQSAWCGASYEPQDVVTAKRDDSIEVLDISGQIVAEVKPKVKKSDSGMKQIVAVVEYISRIAKTQGFSERTLWQPALPKRMDLQKINRKYSGQNENPMFVCFGLLDDPERQKRLPMTVDFKSCGSILVAGESGSGKTTFIQNLLYSLVKQMSPEELNFHILDYSSRMLTLFKPLPHCGEVLQEEDSGALDEFFKMINSFVAQRKKLFSSMEVDSFEAANTIKKIPLILVIIDNIAGLSSSKEGENHSYKLQSYLKNSANYGIKYIITCSHLNEVSSRVRQELGTRICLHMKDKYDYNEILGCKVSYLPPEVPGRGLVCEEGRALEFQNAIIQPDLEEKERIEHIKETVKGLCLQYGMQNEAQRLPTFSETATYEDFARQFKRGRIPLGYSKQNSKLIALPLKQFSALSLYFGNLNGSKPIIKNMLYAANREGMELWVVKRRESSVFDGVVQNELEDSVVERIKLVELNEQEISELRNLLSAEVTQRKTILQEYCLESGLTGQEIDFDKKTFNFLRENTTPVLLLIESYADFCAAVDKISALIIRECFRMAQRKNIYVICCFEPEDNQNIENRALYYGFNQEGNAILFGGQFDKQDVCLLPEIAGLNNSLPYNAGIMSYQSKLHPIIMPCGEMNVEEIDEDDQSVF